jgi:thymidylate kinase
VLARSRSPRSADPLIIALEGLCYAGKTTLAHALAPLVGAVVIGEYTSMASLPPFPPRTLHDLAAALQRFLDVEQHRAHTARTAGTATVLLDRSPLTLIAHEYGMAALGVPCDAVGAAAIYSNAAEAGDILTPDGYLYLTVSDDVTAARQQLRGPVAAHLMNPKVRARIDHACRGWLVSLPPGHVLELDGTVASPELAAMSARWISRLTPSLPLPSWRTMAPVPSLASPPGARPENTACEGDPEGRTIPCGPCVRPG